MRLPTGSSLLMHIRNFILDADGFDGEVTLRRLEAARGTRAATVEALRVAAGGIFGFLSKIR
jgi:hypothetical protein